MADVLPGKRALEGAAILRALGIEARAAAERAGAQQEAARSSPGPG